jgi:hypothetical protein
LGKSGFSVIGSFLPLARLSSAVVRATRRRGASIASCFPPDRCCASHPIVLIVRGRRLSGSRRILTLFLAQAILGLGLAVLAPGRAEAGIDVTYSTSGGFNTPAQSSQVFTLGGESVTVSFAPEPSTTAPPGTVALGELDVTVAGFANSFTLVSTPFTLGVTQTDPVTGSATFGATLTGWMGAGYASLFGLQFANTTIDIGNMSYTLTDAPGGFLSLGPPFFNGTVKTTLYATLADPPPVPEPSTLVMTLTGSLAAAGFWGSRRRLAAR